MASKIKMLRLLQEMRGFAMITNRRPLPRPPGLYLLQLRAHLLGASSPRGKRTISVDMQEEAELSQPIKITHLRREPAPPRQTQTEEFLRLARY